MSRMRPIPETMETIPGYPSTLRIFRIHASQFFYCRCWWQGKMARISTKTAIRSEAIKVAKNFYNDLLLKRAQAPNPEPERVREFKEMAESLIKEDEGRVARGERAASLVADAKHIIYRDLEPFFGQLRLKTIDYGRIQAYVEHVQKRNVSSNTIKNHLIFLRKLLKHAAKHGKLDKLPIFPTISTEDNPRAWLTSKQYRLLRDTIRKSYGETAEKTYVPIGHELRLLTLFLTNTFLRPPDIKNLKNKDIEIVGEKYLRIRATSKVTEAPVISMPNAVTYYKQLLKLHDGMAGPDDFVFFPQFKQRSYAMQTMRLQFTHVLKKAGLKDGRTLYSLRHTAIMFRLTLGDVDLLTLARNCRTSVEMLERFYASHLTPEMNVDQLQRMKKVYGQ